MQRIKSSTPPIISSARDLFSNYDTLFCDVWGVIHNGFKAYKSACAALAEFRSTGGTIILISNAPVPPHRVAEMLDSRAVPRNAWDSIISSGGIALSHIEERNIKKAYCIGPQDRDAAFFERMTAKPTHLEEAEAIVCTGLNDDTSEHPNDYRPRLEKAHARSLELVCVNPDLVVDVGGKLYYCAGAIADIYQEMGGKVLWAGKPHAAAYQSARQAASDLRGAPIEDSRILVIGDSLRTDVLGAANEDLDALFIAAGIHRDEIVHNAKIDNEKLAQLFQTPHTTVAAMPILSL